MERREGGGPETEIPGPVAGGSEGRAPRGVHNAKRKTQDLPRSPRTAMLSVSRPVPSASSDLVQKPRRAPRSVPSPSTPEPEILALASHGPGLETLVCAEGDYVTIYAVCDGCCVRTASLFGDDAYEVRAHPLHPGAVGVVGVDGAAVVDAMGFVHPVPGGVLATEVEPREWGFLFRGVDGTEVEARIPVGQDQPPCFRISSSKRVRGAASYA